jgi:hypothetical protein
MAILFFKDGSRHVIDHIPLHEIEDIQLGTSEVCPPVSTYLIARKGPPGDPFLSHWGAEEEV